MKTGSPKIVLDRRRTRRDSVIGSRLTSEQQDALADQLDKGLSYAKAAEHLLENHGVKLSRNAICRWAMRRRSSLKTDETFANFLQTIRRDRDNATALAGDIGSANSLNEANVLLLSQALFEARRNKDVRGMMQVAKLFASVLSAVTQARRAQAAQIEARRRTKISAFNARTMRNRLEYDAAKAAAKHAPEIVKIMRKSDATDREKIKLVIERLFGKPPEERENCAPPALM